MEVQAEEEEKKKKKRSSTLKARFSIWAVRSPPMGSVYGIPEGAVDITNQPFPANLPVASSGHSRPPSYPPLFAFSPLFFLSIFRAFAHTTA